MSISKDPTGSFDYPLFAFQFALTTLKHYVFKEVISSQHRFVMTFLTFSNRWQRGAFLPL